MRFKPASPLKPLAQHIMFELGVNDSTPEDPLIHADDLKESSNRSDFVFIDPHGEPELLALLLQQLSSSDRADDHLKESSNRSDFVFIDPHGEPELPALLLQQLSSLDRADDFFTKLP